jgi:hypothetical protein
MGDFGLLNEISDLDLFARASFDGQCHDRLKDFRFVIVM